MSAEGLREAAALMRERAEAATPGVWRTHGTVVMTHSTVPFGAKYVADCYDEPDASEADASHIASWHPAVALAVADWLWSVAGAMTPPDAADVPEAGRSIHQRDEDLALAVADAYLSGGAS